MNVCILSPYEQAGKLAFAISQQGDNVSINNLGGAHFIVLYGHREIIKGKLLEDYRGRIVNLHISMLPWNRGADPNLWSWWDDTPKGVSIINVDEGVDTGDIIASAQLTFDPQAETLATSYWALRGLVEDTFIRTWPIIRRGTIGLSQKKWTGGSAHKTKDKERIWKYLPNGYDTPCHIVTELGRSHGG